MGSGVGKSRRVRAEQPLPPETEVVPETEIVLRASRSSGPGGQHVNKTSTRIVAEFDVTNSPTLTDEQKELITQRIGAVVTAVAQDTRSQTRNREVATERLQAKLVAALRVKKKRKPTRVSKAAEEKRVTEKKQRGERKKERQKGRNIDY